MTFRVWFGGYICDLCGGYRGGGQQRIAVRVTTLFAGKQISPHVALHCDDVKAIAHSVRSNAVRLASFFVKV